MNTWVWIVIGAVFAIVVLGVSASALGTRRSRSLQGLEHERRTVEQDDESAGERELEDVRAHDNVKRLR